MAAIDFPASPTVGQAFAAGNGVVYTWNGTLWLASGASSGGDFTAKNTGNFTLSATPVPLGLSTIVTGNAGNWYNTGTGRFTPPAGRYYFQATLFGSHSGAATTLIVDIRKNGTTALSAYATTALANYNGEATVEGLLDANGSDYFEMYASASASTTSTAAYFLAFPISGIKGPPGDPYTGPVGDFYATTTAAIPAAAGTIIFPTVVTGNSGTWYSTSTGRYTPPVGRYKIFACLSGSPTAGAASQACTLRKNGATVVSTSGSAAAAFMWAQAFVEGVFDANGTDFFDVQNGGTLWDRAGANSWFGAIRVSA